jgi:hypothetical protein
MRALILTVGLAACAPLPPTAVSPTEARGLAILHALRATDPCERAPLCSEVRRGNAP